MSEDVACIVCGDCKPQPGSQFCSSRCESDHAERLWADRIEKDFDAVIDRATALIGKLPILDNAGTITPIPGFDALERVFHDALPARAQHIVGDLGEYFRHALRAVLVAHAGGYAIELEALRSACTNKGSGDVTRLRGVAAALLMMIAGSQPRCFRRGCTRAAMVHDVCMSKFCDECAASIPPDEDGYTDLLPYASQLRALKAVLEGSK